MDKLQKLLQRKQDLISAMRGILNKAEEEKRSLTKEEDEDYKKKESELDSLAVEISRERKLAEAEAESRKIEPTKIGPKGTDEPVIKVTDREEDKPFRNLGEFVETVTTNPGAPNLRNYQSNIGDIGGFLIPKEFVSTVLQFSPDENIVRAGAQVFGPVAGSPDAPIEIPVLTQGDKGFYAGVQTYWNGEGRPVNKSGADFEYITLTPHEITGLTSITNKMLRNASQMSSFIENSFRMALNGAEDMAFLTGDGIAKPLGLISPNNTGAILVKRTTANKIVYEDIVEMESKMIASSRSSCFFVASQSAFKELKDLKDSSGNRVYSQILHPSQEGFIGTLDGIPLKLTGKVGTLGNTGDLSLIDPKYYLIKDGISPMIAYSEHADFINGKTLIKIVKSVDGQLWNREPLLLEDGKTEVSGVVILKK